MAAANGDQTRSGGEDDYDYDDYKYDDACGAWVVGIEHGSDKRETQTERKGAWGWEWEWGRHGTKLGRGSMEESMGI